MNAFGCIIIHHVFVAHSSFLVFETRKNPYLSIKPDVLNYQISNSEDLLRVKISHYTILCPLNKPKIGNSFHIQ